jgi:HD-GYP domain-containing protein (c-di-GMP phosphodiesterase class II)
MQHRQPALRRQAGRRRDDAPVGGDQPMATARDDAEAAVGQAGIDAEDDHRNGILRGRSDAFPPSPPAADVRSPIILERDRYTGEHSAVVVEIAKIVAAALGLGEVSPATPTTR